MAVDLSVAIGPVRLTSPLILGSFDALTDSGVFERCFELCGDALGALVSKSTTLDPRQGYPHPKVARFGSGLLVASGNTNPGIARVTREVRTFKHKHPDRVVFGSIVSDGDHPERELTEEYALLAAEYARAGVDGLELNLSCPHLDPRDREHTIVPAQDPELVARLVTAVRSSLSGAGCEHCLVVPKLTGWNCDPTAVALAAERAGADAVTLSNLFPGTGFYTGVTQNRMPSGKQELGEYLLGHGKGAYSGKAMHSAVLLIISNLRKHLQIPLFAAGGCATDLDSLAQTFMAGATAVQTVTPFYFDNPGQMGCLAGLQKLVRQFEDFLAGHHLNSPKDLHRLSLSRRHA